MVQALAKQVDGVLLCSPRMSNDLIEQLSREVPVVVVNRLVEGIPAVVMDVAQGARTAIEHLVGLGHTNLALLGGPRGSWTNREIRRSAIATARAMGVEPHCPRPQPAQLRSRAPRPSRRSAVPAPPRVLAYNDLMAIGVLEGLPQPWDPGSRRRSALSALTTSR